MKVYRTKKEKFLNLLSIGAICAGTLVIGNNTLNNSKSSLELLYLNKAIAINNNDNSFSTQAIKCVDYNNDYYVMFYGEKKDTQNNIQTGAYTYLLPDLNNNNTSQYENIYNLIETNQTLTYNYNFKTPMLNDCKDLVAYTQPISWSQCTEKYIKDLWKIELNSEINVDDNTITM